VDVQIIEKVDRIINKYKKDKKDLLSILQDAQDEYGYLPRDVLVHIREKLNVSLSQIYGVVTFYNAFSLMPRGRHVIMVCTGTTCHVRGAGKLLERAEKELRIRNGETTRDLRFSLETVRCLGCCSLAPVVRIDSDTYGRVKQSEFSKILSSHE